MLHSQWENAERTLDVPTINQGFKQGRELGEGRTTQGDFDWEDALGAVLKKPWRKLQYGSSSHHCPLLDHQLHHFLSAFAKCFF